MGRNSYLGGSTIIGRNGSGWAYDESEVRNDPVKRSASQITPTPSTNKKTKKKSPKQLWRKYVNLTAEAKMKGEKPKALPIKLRHKLKKPRKKEKFWQDVELAILELQKDLK